MRLRTLLASGALALSTLALGCTDDAPEASGLGESWSVRGVYNGTRLDGEAASVQHESIPGLMDAMTMDFLLARPDEIASLEEGDKVAFRLDLVDGRIRASGFETLPDTTTLDLAEPGMSPSRTDLTSDSTAAPEASGETTTE